MRPQKGTTHGRSSPESAFLGLNPAGGHLPPKGPRAREKATILEMDSRKHRRDEDCLCIICSYIRSKDKDISHS